MRVPINRTQHFFLVLFCFGVIFWLGSITSRAIIANEFFIPTTLTYRPGITEDAERTLFQLVSATSSIALTAYAAVLVSSLYLLITLPFKIREQGWLLAASILFFLFVPVEAFTAYLDIKFILLWMNTKGLLQSEGLATYHLYSTELRETLSHRIGALSGLPVIALLCYFTSVVLLVWQPMKRIPSGDEPPTA